MSTKKSSCSSRPRQKFTPEFKAEAAATVEASGRQIAKVARELGIPRLVAGELGA